jgi:predicted nucleic acid-binding protein
VTTTSPISLFLDASVLFAACYSSTGSAFDLVTTCPTSNVHLVTSERAELETRRNLSNQPEHAIKNLEVFLAKNLKLVSDPTEQTIRLVAQLIVTKDVPIVAAAIDSGSAAIVTYDRKHLISLGTSIELLWNIRVMTPAEVLSTIVG